MSHTPATITLPTIEDVLAWCQADPDAEAGWCGFPERCVLANVIAERNAGCEISVYPEEDGDSTAAIMAYRGGTVEALSMPDELRLLAIAFDGVAMLSPISRARVVPLCEQIIRDRAVPS